MNISQIGSISKIEPISSERKIREAKQAGNQVIAAHGSMTWHWLGLRRK